MYTMASCLPTMMRTTGSKAVARGALTELLLLQGKLRGAPFPPHSSAGRSKERRGQGDLGTAAEVATRRGGGGVARMGGGGDDGES
jgi:hypothetical protein